MIDWDEDLKPEPQPLEVLQDAATLLAWMQHHREVADAAMEEYRSAARELDRLLP